MFEVEVSIVDDGPFDGIVDDFSDFVVVVFGGVVVVGIEDNRQPSVCFEYFCEVVVLVEGLLVGL